MGTWNSMVRSILVRNWLDVLHIDGWEGLSMGLIVNHTSAAWSWFSFEFEGRKRLVAFCFCSFVNGYFHWQILISDHDWLFTTDFGLAKELKLDNKTDTGRYKLSGHTGSLAYMAPEVALGTPYNETCDVYSFSILLWQMLKAETPFENYASVKSFQSKVVKGGVRPAPDPKWAADITDLMRRSWSPDISKRPVMDEVCETLRAAINRDTDEEVEEIMDASRRSEISLRGGK